MQSCCLQPSHTCVELSYPILTLIVGFNTAASLQRVRDCSHFVESLSFCDQNSDAAGPLDIIGTVGPPQRQLSFLLRVRLAQYTEVYTLYEFACRKLAYLITYVRTFLHTDLKAVSVFGDQMCCHSEFCLFGLYAKLNW